jgi:hypothetical protein
VWADRLLYIRGIWVCLQRPSPIPWFRVTEAVLNHIRGSRGGMAGVYQRHDWAAEKRAALDAWAAHVLAIAEQRMPADNVVRLARAG